MSTIEKCPGCNKCSCCNKWMHEVDLYWHKYMPIPEHNEFRCDYKKDKMMASYTLVNGPFDGTKLEMPHQVDRIALQTGHTLPGIEYVKKTPDGLQFTVVPVFEAVYDEFGDIDPDSEAILSNCSEEDVERHEGYPLFYNTKASGILE